MLPELVTLVAHHAWFSGSTTTLNNMRCVSRTCYDAATPYRFRELHLSRNDRELEGRFSPGIGLVRLAFFTNCVDRIQEELLSEIFESIPRLEVLEYDGRLPKPPAFRALIDSCKGLTVLHLSIFKYYQKKPSWYLRPHLEGLCNLRELVLDGIPLFDHAWWTQRLAQLLVDSPGLKKLGLGLATFPTYDDDIMGAFDRLCDLYGETGASPLSLTSLVFKRGFYPFTLRSLTKLTDLTCLQDVYVASLKSWLEELRTSTSQRIAFEAFAPPHAPNLRYFRMEAYDRAIHEHLSTVPDPGFMRRLAISARLWVSKGQVPMRPPCYGRTQTTLHSHDRSG